ncbi:hypothetical protein YPPY91_2321, partial [Yersinia pestis PY-91]
MRGQRLY